ncbi:MAG: HAMP domain-containing protein [Phycisphaerae bacterium]|nr:HAMP domain-containing protein [Phycisphaerae bacterium]
MYQHFQTLRFRIAALYFLVFGVILIILCGLILQVREQQLRQDFDERLTNRAETILEVISIRGVRAIPVTTRRGKRRPDPFALDEYYVQILSPKGEVLEHSPNMKDATLPLSEDARAARRGGVPVLETLTGLNGQRPSDEDGPLRLLTLFQDEPEVGRFYLQVALSLAPVQSSIEQLRSLFLVVIPLALVLAAGGSWLMARRSLAPIAQIVRQARELTAARLDRRIETRPAKDEVSEMVTVINEMLDRLESAFRSQERFIADVSHELKTPLSVLLGQVQVLLQQPRPIKEHERFVASIEDELRQLARLADSLLVWSRAESGIPLRPMPVSVNDVVMEAVQACEPLAETREVRLIPSLVLTDSDEPEPTIAGDPALLRVMMENLIRNAIRHAPIGSAVDVVLEIHNHHVGIHVRDAGPGIPEEHLEHVFDRFFRIHRGQEQPPGAGLGLAIARGVTRLHNGSIAAANRAEGGCEFTVLIPLSPAAA